MADATQINGYWGPTTSTTEWCEKNYAVTPYLAEFYNTISNFPGIILGLIGLINSIKQRFEKRFSFLHLSTMTLGFGSILFHATMQTIQQQSEETPMVWVILMYIYVLYSPDWHYTSTMPTVLFIYGTLFAALHSWFRFVLIFQVHCVFLSFLCLPRMYKYYIHTTDPHAKQLAHMYILSMVLGGLCWILDWTFCGRVSTWAINPQGHAWWHLLRGFSSYFANTFFQFCRAQQRDWDPELRYFWGLPYVKISKPKRE